MTFFLINILMALVWMFLWGSFDIYTLLAGLVLGYIMLAPMSYVMDGETYGSRIVRLIRFTFYFIRILVKANWDVAKVVLTPGFNQQCRIIRYSVDGLNDLAVTALANAITLTPGTLSLDVSDDNKWLYIHCMIGHDRQSVENDINDLRKHILEEFL